MPSGFKTEELIAWCVVPFDAAKRGPVERAQMLQELGLRHLAYDWREEHVASWDDEASALKEHGIELSAFWCTSSLDPVEANQRIFSFLKKHNLRTELWFMLPEWKLAEIKDEAQRLKAAIGVIEALANAASQIDCKVGIYNHGGWSGKPGTLLKLMEGVESENVGIVYNLHHAHEDLEGFEQALKKMKPHLYCLNLNGTTKSGPKILPIGQGKQDKQLYAAILASGYQGPFGILDHLNEQDAKVSLERNLSGLRRITE